MTSGITRRQTLAIVGGAVPGVALAQGTTHHPNLGERSLGSASAKATVVEYHSFTCHVCQRFKLEVFPEFKSKFIEPGLVRFVMRDFPLDYIALEAAQVSRCVPADRYFSFVALLYSRQDTWKGGHGSGIVNTQGELRRLAALAGVSPADVDQCLADQSLMRAIATEAQDGATRFAIRSTPSFVVGERMYAGLQSVADFDRILGPLLRG